MATIMQLLAAGRRANVVRAAQLRTLASGPDPRHRAAQVAQMSMDPPPGSKLSPFEWHDIQGISRQQTLVLRLCQAADQEKTPPEAGLDGQSCENNSGPHRDQGNRSDGGKQAKGNDSEKQSWGQTMLRGGRDVGIITVGAGATLATMISQRMWLENEEGDFWAAYPGITDELREYIRMLERRGYPQMGQI